VVVEHLRPVEQVLGHSEGAMRIAGEQHALGQVGRRLQVNRADFVLQRQGGEP
jgi:hypothetical protein